MNILSLAADFFSSFWHELAVVLLSCVPLIESRYAIVICSPLFPEFSSLQLAVLTQIGAALTALVLLLLLRPIMDWMKNTKVFRSIVEKVEKHGKKKGEKLAGKIENSTSKRAKVLAAVIGVYVFVAIPLPGTGVWTGCLVATLLNIRFKYAFPAILLGSITATAIMFALSSIFFKGIVL